MATEHDQIFHDHISGVLREWRAQDERKHPEESSLNLQSRALGHCEALLGLLWGQINATGSPLAIQEARRILLTGLEEVPWEMATAEDLTPTAPTLPKEPKRWNVDTEFEDEERNTFYVRAWIDDASLRMEILHLEVNGAGQEEEDLDEDEREWIREKVLDSYWEEEERSLPF